MCSTRGIIHWFWYQIQKKVVHYHTARPDSRGTDYLQFTFVSLVTVLEVFTCIIVQRR